MAPRVERITKNFVQVSFPAEHGVRRYFSLSRDGATWTVTRARGFQTQPLVMDGFRTQRDALAYCIDRNAVEAAEAK